ncbi:cytochrome P450 [Saccharothrix violaceirubra]|uniref:Cytochrome P450 n=1 Tax=Saccharothrix violaceirubra TaxID=413306 RepID=A0A7W7T4G6_9PSEU|nr:cytochrome P450 [Saccharothrix violaceirubra]MBB4965160.1 cytochrome P450 [Saccharothrix violaceirubra]
MAWTGTTREYPFREPHRLDLEPEYARLRESEPLCRISLPYGGQAWLATRYEDVRFVLSDPRFSRAAVLDRDVPRTSPRRLTDATLHTMDPPDHNRLRRLVAHAFSPRRVDALTDQAREIAAGLLDDVVRTGPPADLVTGLALPLPIEVICRMLGVPLADREAFTGLIDVAMATTAFPAERIHRAFADLKSYLAELVRQRRTTPTDDLLGALVEARDRDDRLGEDELVVLGTTLLYAGLETTTNQIGNVVYNLLTHPGQWAALRADPTLLDTAVDELLRFTPVVTTAGFTRIAVEDLEIGGVPVRAGDAVMVHLDSANRDDRVFDRPDELDVTRRPNPHVAFGFGPHYCVAARLAKAEIQVALGALVERFPGLRLAADPDSLSWRTGRMVRGLDALPVAW